MIFDKFYIENLINDLMIYSIDTFSINAEVLYSKDDLIQFNKSLIRFSIYTLNTILCEKSYLIDWEHVQQLNP